MNCLLIESMPLLLQIPALKDLFTAILKKALNDDKSQWDQAMQVRRHARLSCSLHSLSRLKCSSAAKCMPSRPAVPRCSSVLETVPELYASSLEGAVTVHCLLASAAHSFMPDRPAGMCWSALQMPHYNSKAMPSVSLHTAMHCTQVGCHCCCIGFCISSMPSSQPILAA